MPSMTVSEDKKIWENCLNYMSLRVKKHSYNTWFKYTKGVYDENGAIRITVPNQFVADWLSGRYSDLISEAIEETAGKSLSYTFEIRRRDETNHQTEIEFPRKSQVSNNRPHRNSSFPLNKKFLFDNFVVGKFNQFAHAAATAVAEAPAQTRYNPLLIYGGTGLGKTHLAQAIAHYLHEHFPGKNALYATSERFTSDFIKSISDRTTNQFTTIYRTADVLLVDDIQFLSGKESTQEQFFHTFNDLFHSGKQLVLTSDRHPTDIKGLEERLLSRFSSGLVADLQPPDLETQVAILRRKAEEEGVSIPEEVFYLIADNVTSNIRELEGCFTRLLAYASLEKSEIDHAFAVRVLGKEILRYKKEITISHIQKKTAEFFHVDCAFMTAKKRTAPIAFARQVAMYLSRRHTDFSLKSIGDAFGGRDHSTVIHACELIAKKVETDFDFREKMNNLSAAILC
jgi:chromosomal replication initiator protein